MDQQDTNDPGKQVTTENGEQAAPTAASDPPPPPPPPPPEPDYPQALPIYALERAQALPEITGDAYAPFQSDDPLAILAFKDADGRTMRVAVTVDGLAKIAATL